MSTGNAKTFAGIWQMIGLTKMIGLAVVVCSALAFSACTAPAPASSAAEAAPTKAAAQEAAAVSASNTTTETQPAAAVSASNATTETTTQTQAVTSTQTTTQTTTETQPAAESQSSAGETLIMLYDDATLGKILVDAKGMTLYVYDRDTENKSNCAADCVAKWPLLTVTDENAVIKAGDGVTAKFGVIKRDDGKFQVTANGLPLYYYIDDKASGDVTGQAVGQVWWVLGADGNKISQ